MDVTLPSEISSSRREISLKTSSESLQLITVEAMAGIILSGSPPDSMPALIKNGSDSSVFILYIISFLTLFSLIALNIYVC